MKTCLTGIIFIFLFITVKSQNRECTVNKPTFKDNEVITYTISYNWFIIWTEVGSLRFTVNNEFISGKNLLHLKAKGETYESWNWLCKVDDLYETWVDPESLKPYFFNRQVSECGFDFSIQYHFNQKELKAYSTYHKYETPEQKDTITIHSCTYDVMSAIYYARTIDYSKFNIYDTIVFDVIIDRELFETRVTYLGKETIQVKGTGKVECHKVSVPLIEGTIFNKGDYCMVWITTDKNRIPVYLKSPIIIGSVKARIHSVKGTKYPVKWMHNKEKEK